MIKLMDIVNEIILPEEVYVKPKHRSTPINNGECKLLVNQLSKTLKINMLNAIDSYASIYRGMNNISTYLIVDPKNFERVSANTSNYYTTLMDNFSEWNAYPKRAKSLICSTDSETAEQYGGFVYYVFPLELNSKFGKCSKSDIWYSFRQSGIYSLDDFNDAIKNKIIPSLLSRNDIKCLNS